MSTSYVGTILSGWENDDFRSRLRGTTGPTTDPACLNRPTFQRARKR
jgi:hypothetical protein